MKQPHIIQRQVLDMTFPQRANAFEFQNRISELYQTQIVGVLEEVCRQLDSQDEYLQIEKLEIDLGNLPALDLEVEFPAKVREDFFEALSARAHSIRRLPLNSPPGGVVTDKTEKNRGSPASSSVPDEDRILSATAFKTELIRHFLRTGRLPWWAEVTDAAKPEALLTSLLLEASEEIRPLVEAEIKAPDIRRRLIYQFSDSLLIGLVALLAPGEEENIKGWIQDFGIVFQQVQLDNFSEQEAIILVWDSVFAEGDIAYKKTFNVKGFWQSVIAKIARQTGHSYRRILFVIHATVERLPFARRALQSPLPQFVEMQVREIQVSPPRKGKGRPLSSQPNRIAAPAESLSPENSEASPESGSKKSQLALVPRKTDTSPADVQRGQQTGGLAREKDSTAPLGLEGFEPPASAAIQEIDVENAGLVLLWPYLSQFLGQFDLLADNTFVDDTAASRAIHLLQYLVTGAEETPEYLLPLNKVLCGWDMDKPVRKKIDLSDPEKAEAEKLLNMLISHWKALKKTSIAGLRSSFLQRNGILTEMDARWKLQVERKAYDLLLEHLPWGISMIKLSWMEKMLLVEW